MPFVSACCQGERCYCGAPAEHKVEETIFHDDPHQHRHPFTTYICHEHFVQLIGPAAEQWRRVAEQMPAMRFSWDGFGSDPISRGEKS